MKRTPRRPGRFRRRRAGECPTRLAERLARVLSRRVDDVTRRAAGDLSEKDFSLAVADISRLVMATARLKKLERTDAEAEAPGKNLDSMEEYLLNIMYPEQMAAHRRGRGATVAGEGGLG